MLAIIGLLFLPSLTFADCSVTGSQILSFYVASDTNNWVLGPSTPNGGQAVQVSPVSAWTASIPGANWIWDSSAVTSPEIDQTCFFINEFFIQGTPISGSYQVAADNRVWTSINGQSVNCDVLSLSYTSSNQRTCDVTSFLKTGMNVIQITVTNDAQPGGNSGTNPAAVLYKLALKSKIPA